MDAQSEGEMSDQVEIIINLISSIMFFNPCRGILQIPISSLQAQNQRVIQAISVRLHLGSGIFVLRINPT